jgi:hypothetical protein
VTRRGKQESHVPDETVHQQVWGKFRHEELR